jgi:D-alanyl-D-alanine dipeptidase
MRCNKGMSFEFQHHPDAHLADVEYLPPVGYERVLDYSIRELDRLKPIYAKLVQSRIDLYGASSELSSDIPVTDQTYDDNSYHAAWYKKELRLRHGGAEFHNESEKLDDHPDDTPEQTRRKAAYRQSILTAMKELGGYSLDLTPGKSSDPLDQKLGIRESILDPKHPIEAGVVIVPAAAGISNHMRIRDTLRNIESGAIQTNRIIIATGERTVGAAEQSRVEAKGFRAGATEFELATKAFEDLTGYTLPETEPHTMPANYGIATPDTKFIQATVPVRGMPIEVTIIEAAYDRTRRHDVTGKQFDRANTDETFYATLPFMKKGAETVVIESHDVWIPYQEVIGNRVLGLYADKTIMATGPYKDDRVIYTENGEIDLSLGQGVVDEMGKRIDDLTKLLIEAENAKSPELALLGRLVKPIPDMSGAHGLKSGYREHPIDTQSSPEISNEPLVTLSDYGIAGQSYYSRGNALANEGLPGVSPEVKLRKSIAETLSIINHKLQSPLIADFFGGAVELYVEEGVRSQDTQRHLWSTAIPDLLKAQHPHLNDEEINERVKDLIAKPREEDSSPSPHETGAAIDVILRYKQDSPTFVKGTEVPMGHFDGNTSGNITPDYYEHISLTDDDDPRIRNFRRAFYNIMTGSAFNITTGLVVNPTEFWHWSRQDQLAARVGGQGKALYGLPENGSNTK